MGAEMELDDIFARLADVKPGDGAEKPTTGRTTYDELKKKVTHLPSIEVQMIKKDKKAPTSRHRRVRKINESVESVIPADSRKRTNTDKRVLKEERSKKWFEIPPVEMTEEMKRDLLIIKNRKYLDPKRFYKGEKWEIPEKFQMGVVVEGVGEYAGRVKRKDRGKTLVDELLKDGKSKEWLDKAYKK